MTAAETQGMLSDLETLLTDSSENDSIISTVKEAPSSSRISNLSAHVMVLQGDSRLDGSWSTVEELADRGLNTASRWLAELLLSRPDSGEAQSMPAKQFQPTYMLAKRHFDCHEFKQCIRVLQNNAHPKAVWLRLYSQYLESSRLRGAEPFEREQTTEVALGQKMLTGILAEIKTTSDPFLLYLRALVLDDLGRRLEAMASLVESVNAFPYNWSAWLHLIKLLDGEEELLATFSHLPEDHAMTKLFHISATIEVHRASDTLRVQIDQLLAEFPGSVHLKSQSALLEYHMRDFDLAEKLFDEIAEEYPNRLDEIDTYSNILYVMGKRAKLSQLAHLYSQVDKDRPETCCLIGNLYSIRGEHTKAVAYFRRAIKLDPGYLAAWTLMGHEYVELSNTHAAIEAYRRACAANSKDYRAWYGLGQAYELLGMHAYALRYYQRATALRPFDARMWQAVGNCYTRTSKPHEVLKCFKRAQLFVEPDDVSMLKRLAEQYLSMSMFQEAALYWGKVVEVGEMHSIPPAEYLAAYNNLAAFEMGEYHVTNRKRRLIGDLALAEVYLKKVISSNGDDVDYAKRLYQTLRSLQV